MALLKQGISTLQLSKGIVSAVLGFLPVFSAQAEVVSDLALSHTATASDNVNRAPDDASAVQDLASTLEMEYSLFANEPQFRADLTTDLAFTQYVDEAFEPNLAGNLRFISVIDLLSDRVSWIVGDLYQERSRIGGSLLDPDDRVRTNYLFMGPRVVLNPTRVDQVDIRVLAFEESVHERDNRSRNTQRFNTRVGWSHRLSPHKTLSLWGDHRIVRPENGDALSLLDGYVRYNVARPLGDIEVDAGVTQVYPDNGEEQSNALLRMSLSRRLSRFSRFEVNAGREYSDLGDLEIRDQLIQVSDGVRASDGVFLEDSIGLALERKVRRTTLSLTARYRELDYTNDAVRDTRSMRMAMDWEWSLDAQQMFGFNLSTRQDDLSQSASRDAEKDEHNAFGLRYRYRHTRAVDSLVELRVLNNRNSLDGDENYDVRSLLWTLRWRPINRYNAQNLRQQRRELQTLIK